VGYVERESYAAATLVARMEDAALDCAPVWDDVATFDGRSWRGLVDIIHGGYPCQPFSVAGCKLGNKDPRHIWPHIARIVSEIEPSLCFFENVGGHLRLGFEEVHDDLRSMGYRVKAGLFTAEEVGATHKRERLFILAYRESIVCERCFTERGFSGQSKKETGGQCCLVAYTTRARARQHEFGSWSLSERGQQNVGDPNGARLEGRGTERNQCADKKSAFPPGPTDAESWRHYLQHRPDLEPAVRGGADGLAYRVDRLRLCGNGVVPLVAAYAFRTLATAANIKLNGT
jgi:DNA (cytosine-5)-methyltransferase 1